MSWIHKLWTKYQRNTEKALPINFLHRSFIQKRFLKSRRLSGIHFIGNVLAHYLGRFDEHDTVAALDTIDILQLVVLLHWPLEYIVNHLHHVQVFLARIDMLELEWRTYQKENLALPYAVNFEQLYRVKYTLQIIYSRQIYMEDKIKNYNRKLLLVFRLFHSQYHPWIAPKLLWGDDNDWISGMDMDVINTSFEDLLNDEPNLGCSERYGCPLDTKRVVCYYDHVQFKPTPEYW